MGACFSSKNETLKAESKRLKEAKNHTEIR